MHALALGGLGSPELLILLGVLVLLLGATRLPELSRGAARALRSFRTETRAGYDDEVPDPVPRG